MKQQQLQCLLMTSLALCVCDLPATASTLFSDLGPSGSYESAFTAGGWAVQGSGAYAGANAVSTANLFTVAGNGSLSVSEIDLAVGYLTNSPDTFAASIFTDNAGTPGNQVADANWSLTTSLSYNSDNTCCAFSVTNITGVDLTGGAQYFMILSPLSLTDSSDNGWFMNNQGVSGLVLGADNGGSWSGSQATLGAFAVLSGTSSAPEPSSLALLGAGLIGMLLAYRRRPVH